MKKNFIYALIGCFVLSLAACSTDPEDATGKHVYGENENPYLKTNANATITTSLEFPIVHLESQTIKLTDYADKFQSLLGMTVDETLAALSNGNIVFYPINASRSCWNKTATTKGSNGWYFNVNGGVCDSSTGVLSVELNTAEKSLIVNCEETAPLGAATLNIGFAIDNGMNYDDYVRFTFNITITDPSKNIVTGTLPNADYDGFSINFADYAESIETCTGLTVDEFSKAIVDSGDARYDDSLTPTWALYLVNEDGSWDTTCNYTANGLGYWLDANSKVVSYGEGSVFYAESGDGYIFIGRYPNVASGTVINLHFVYAMIDDPSRYVEFIVVGTME